MNITAKDYEVVLAERYREVTQRLQELGGTWSWYNSHGDLWLFEITQTTPPQIIVTEQWAGVSGCAPMTIGEERRPVNDWDLIFLDVNVPKS